MTAKNTICLWYEGDAESAAQFYARTFPDSSVDAIRRAPSDFPDGQAGDVLTVEFTVCGVACIGLNDRHCGDRGRGRRKVSPTAVPYTSDHGTG